jgi:hypothetical protein
MTDDKETSYGAENANTTSDHPHSPPLLTELPEPTGASILPSPDGGADSGADRIKAAGDEGAGQDAATSDDLQPPVLPFETIRDTAKGKKPVKAAKEPPTPEEKALKWLEAAARLVGDLPHDPRWPASSGERSLRARLWVVRDRLDTFTKKPPKEFCVTPPGPSARELYSLFGQIVGAIRECKDTTEEVPKTWGDWNTAKRETILQRLLEVAETHEAKLPEPTELITVGRMSPSRVDAGMASIARGLHQHLAQ